MQRPDVGHPRWGNEERMGLVDGDHAVVLRTRLWEGRTVQMRIPFSDVDMHGHVHNGRYVAYAEDAINAFLREHRLADRFAPQSSKFVYHVKKVQVVYNRALGFDDLVEVTARVAGVGRTSLTFEVEVHPADSGDEPAVQVEVVWVCVDPVAQRAAPVPEETVAALAVVSTSVQP